MRVTKSVVFGLVCLVCTADSSKATGRPFPAKRQEIVTVTSSGCTAVCAANYWDAGEAVGCDVDCDDSSWPKTPATSTPKSTSTSTSTSTYTSTVVSTVTSKPRPALNQRSVASTKQGACYETCSINEEEGDYDCYFSCNADFSTVITATSTSAAALHQRTVVSTIEDGCTAICWDLMPGTECDVQCSSNSKTEMPGNIALSVPLVSIILH